MGNYSTTTATRKVFMQDFLIKLFRESKLFFTLNVIKIIKKINQIFVFLATLQAPKKIRTKTVKSQTKAKKISEISWTFLYVEFLEIEYSFYSDKPKKKKKAINADAHKDVWFFWCAAGICYDDFFFESRISPFLFVS